MKNEEFYTWSQFDNDCEQVVRWAKDQNFKSVFGIPRGGLIPAVKLSHLLDIPLVLNLVDVTPNTLVIDDIIDTGATVKRLNFADGVKIASLYFHEKAETRPDFFVRVKTKWVRFPWETENTSRYDNAV